MRQIIFLDGATIQLAIMRYVRALAQFQDCVLADVTFEAPDHLEINMDVSASSPQLDDR